MRKTLLVGLCIAGVLLCSPFLPADPSSETFLKWNTLASYPPVGDQDEALGVAGPFVGVHNDALIVAGGANFPKPYWSSEKVWHDQIWVLVEKEGTYRWLDGGTLPHPVAYGASVSTGKGVVCAGGNNGETVFSDVYRLRWNPEKQNVVQEELPSLPRPCTGGSATKIEQTVYLAGGKHGSDPGTAMTNFWSLDLSGDAGEPEEWQQLPAWPGPPRIFNLTVSQYNGRNDCVYVMSGRRTDRKGNVQFLTDQYRFNPDHYNPGGSSDRNPWKRRADVPQPVVAGTGAAIGPTHFFVLGGDDGEHFGRAAELKGDHPGFPEEAFKYDTITDTWVSAGSTPANHVTTKAVKWDGSIVIPSGEVRPRVRSTDVWTIDPVSTSGSFGWVNSLSLGTYLLILVMIGAYFYGKNQDTDDFFRGGQEIPWWVAGLSIFATMLSSLTFVAFPSKSYATDWVFMLVNVGIVLVAPFIIYYILPFFRRIDATSAYEFLEKRFHVSLRLFGSLSFVLFQIGRMAIVMFLPSLALATITPLSVEICILIMGGLSIIYCTMGGIKAVVWTDALQTVVLLGGALLSFILIMFQIDGGVTDFYRTAADNAKFHVANWNFSPGSYATLAIWVVLFGGIGQALVPYASDQTVIQRYMSVDSEKRASQAIWTNALLSIPATVLFFGLGTALFVFYKHHPGRLDPTLKLDAIFPLFIARELPVGVAGLVVAALFAAAQSTIGTSMNSISTAIVTDFFKRFRVFESEEAYLHLARFLTFLMGALGTTFALVFAISDVKYMLDTYLEVLGLITGPMCGLFLLGIFTTRANIGGALIGTAVGVAGIAVVKQGTGMNFLLYSWVGITLCFGTGYLSSFFFPVDARDHEGLTIHTIED